MDAFHMTTYLLQPLLQLWHTTRTVSEQGLHFCFGNMQSTSTRTSLNGKSTYSILYHNWVTPSPPQATFNTNKTEQASAHKSLYCPDRLHLGNFTGLLNNQLWWYKISNTDRIVSTKLLNLGLRLLKFFPTDTGGIQISITHFLPTRTSFFRGYLKFSEERKT